MSPSVSKEFLFLSNIYQHFTLSVVQNVILKISEIKLELKTTSNSRELHRANRILAVVPMSFHRKRKYLRKITVS